MESQWEQKARKIWLEVTPRPDPEVLRTQIWSPLESSNFATQALLPLENLHILERYLWPIYTAESSNQHVVLLAAFSNLKRHGNLSLWPLYETQPALFSTLFQRILSLNLDKSLPASVRLILLEFVIGAFKSLEKDFVRKECAPLVSINIWHNLHSQTHREKEIQKSIPRQKAWRSAQKRFDNASKDVQVKQRFERAWLYSMVLDFLKRLYATQVNLSDVTYCERFLEFLSDLISQLPTRRYTIVLLNDLQVLPALRSSKVYRREDHDLVRNLTDLYRHFSDFAIDETGDFPSQSESVPEQHYGALAHLQKIALQYFEPKLKVLALSNYASLDKPEELKSHLSALSDLELEELCRLLDLRTEFPSSLEIPTGRALFLEILITKFGRPQTFESSMRSTSLLPTEQSLYDPKALLNETYGSERPLALPKLNLQYLNIDDFMWRSFNLYQVEAFYEIRTYMEGILRRMKPRTVGGQTKFDGYSKMSLPIDKPAIIDVGPPNVGETIPSYVRAEIILDLGKLNDRVCHEWESLRPKDIIFFLAIHGNDMSKTPTNGDKSLYSGSAEIKLLRTAEVVQLLDDNGKALRDSRLNGYSGRSRRRRLLVNLDTLAFQSDQAQLTKTKIDTMSSVNVIVRRQGRENNFKPVLETIQKLVGTRMELPTWLREVYLGYGDPKSASFGNMQSRVESIDYLDTFLDWQHLQESFVGQSLIFGNSEGQPGPPYVLEPFSQMSESTATNPRKRRRDQMETNQDATPTIKVKTYLPSNKGPYPVDKARQNMIRFTPKQISAIMSGTQPGLTMIIGPPGTGKTDVATQIINILYHNFPSERILLVAHSNQALNQLFQKIIALDIDSRHLLRLGHGEDELETEASYSKYGRVESFLENRQYFLGEVNRLAASLHAEGAHGSTCETADYFNQVFVRPAWTKFWSFADSDSATIETISTAFPFSNYFSNAPIPELFPQTASIAEAREIAKGCQYHLDRIFSELESIRPFEILRNPRDQANHLLLKEARIIAMTSTHAAMRRSDIAALGFRCDTLIMEEAAQITEIESFIPCAIQNTDPKSGELPLKRLVLVGDHLQNSPVVQNLALRQYANFEQSLFARFVRLGVPTVSLDQQGRCRPSIAELFSWRYENLGNLPHLSTLPEFVRANAGFKHEFQFIDVPDYQGQGEREPTPHFIQNLGEAEYTVALFQYMRLLGYPAKSISILATYAGQKALIRDVLEHRCKGNRLFGMPKTVTTVDKYQGEQNDYVILSLVRTKSVGYLRDVRRLTVALSRARLGLYVLGRRDLFESCVETKTAIDRLTAKSSDKLELVVNEMFPTQRKVDGSSEKVQTAAMESVEHLGQWVYNITQEKVKAMGGTINLLESNGDVIDAAPGGDDIDEDAAEDLAHEADLEADPLHENVA